MVWKKLEQLGTKGKDGRTYLVRNEKGQIAAMKTFRRNKSLCKLRQEYDLQLLAHQAGVAPRPWYYNARHRYIIMDKLDGHLFHSGSQPYYLSEKNQRNIIILLQRLDRAGVFHNDGNLNNFMYGNGRLYIIDYGLAEIITPELCQKLGTNRPNLTMMSIALVAALRRNNSPQSSYNILINTIPIETQKKYGLWG
jgi:predicted Ser/Thr protein kinase